MRSLHGSTACYPLRAIREIVVGRAAGRLCGLRRNNRLKGIVARLTSPMMPHTIFIDVFRLLGAHQWLAASSALNDRGGFWTRMHGVKARSCSFKSAFLVQ